jgi:hypothetical protein
VTSSGSALSTGVDVGGTRETPGAPREADVGKEEAITQRSPSRVLDALVDEVQLLDRDLAAALCGEGRTQPLLRLRA